MLVERAQRWALVVTILACHAETPAPESELSSGGAPPAGGVSAEPEPPAPPEEPGAPAPGLPPPAAPDEPSEAPASAASDAGLAPIAENPGPGDASTPPLDAPLPAGVQSRFPRGGQSAVCLDAPLRLSFAGPVALGSQGRVRILASDRPESPVDVIELGAATPPDTLAGRQVNRVLPIFIDGADAVIYPRRAALQPDTRYEVSVDPGVFVDAEGNPVGDTGTARWSFRTGAAPEVDAANGLRVDREAGPFCTIQSALDAIGAGSAGRVEIDVAAGTYHELLYANGKRNVTLRGADAASTVISYPNNDRLNPGTAARAMVTALNADGLIVEGLTLHNTTPQGGSQAEALRVSGDRVILRRSRFLSLQDTLLLDGLVYVADAYVEGNVDFVWGYGTAYFERSEIKVVGRPGVIVQSRNDAAGRGYFFVDSRLTSDPGLGGTTLARIDASLYPDSEVVFIDCQLGAHITPQGWTVTGDTATAALRFLEFRSTDLSGQLLDVSQRHPASRQLDADEAAELRDKASLLGGWDPEG